jgi:hypothetical protein
MIMSGYYLLSFLKLNSLLCNPRSYILHVLLTELLILLFIVHLTEWFELFVEALMDLNARRSLLFVAAACSLS